MVMGQVCLLRELLEAPFARVDEEAECAPPGNRR